jgi:hypothetical protein
LPLAEREPPREASFEARIGYSPIRGETLRGSLSVDSFETENACKNAAHDIHHGRH